MYVCVPPTFKVKPVECHTSQNKAGNEEVRVITGLGVQGGGGGLRASALTTECPQVCFLIL